ncbi:MAG: serine/threonine-protein kinase [Myxococcales bacterium]
MELLAGDRLGKYEVVGRLAAGGMAEVYLARSLGHAGFSKPVALKRMLPELACEHGFREMFMQEAAVAARLSHPNIVQIFDFAEEQGELYLAMEYIHGVTLKQLNSESYTRGKTEPELRLSPLIAAAICRGVARGLAHAWQVPDEQGRPSHFIHRDVSPHNILLSFEGDVKLADFGIARPAERRTSVGLLKGKLLYMAPEQILGGDLDARTDVFALGIVLYEAAMNLRKPLFDASDEGSVKQAVQARRVVPPARMDPDFPKGLSAVIMKALERDPADRFQSAFEFADALGEVIHREAKGPGDYDLQGFMRRFYNEPPALRALWAAASAAPRAQAGVAVAAQVPALLGSGPAVKGDDPFAETVLRASREAPSSTSSTPPAPADRQEGVVADTKRDRPLSLEAAKGRIQRLWRGRRRIAAVAAIGGAVLIAGLVALAASRDEAPAGERAVEGQTAAVVAAASEAASSPKIADGMAPLASEQQKVEPGKGPQAAPRVESAQTTPEAPERASAAPVAGGAQEQRQQAAEQAPVAAAAPVAQRIESPKPKANTRKTVPEKQTGVLVVHVKPWAFVWVDQETFTGGREQEAAPIIRRILSVGRHVVHVQDPSGRRTSIPVTLRPGQETRITDPFGLEG